MTTSLGVTGTGRLFIVQTIVGVGIPVDVQEMLIDAPSSTDMKLLSTLV